VALAVERTALPSGRLAAMASAAASGYAPHKVSIRTTVNSWQERVQGGPRTMPSAYTLLYASPLCFARTMLRKGQHGRHFTCYRPLRYLAPSNEWHCGACGVLIAGEVVAARTFS
jgi:hypothetical protein